MCTPTRAHLQPPKFGWLPPGARAASLSGDCRSMGDFTEIRVFLFMLKHVFVYSCIYCAC